MDPSKKKRTQSKQILVVHRIVQHRQPHPKSCLGYQRPANDFQENIATEILSNKCVPCQHFGSGDSWLIDARLAFSSIKCNVSRKTVIENEIRWKAISTSLTHHIKPTCPFHIFCGFHMLKLQEESNIYIGNHSDRLQSTSWQPDNNGASPLERRLACHPLDGFTTLHHSKKCSCVRIRQINETNNNKYTYVCTASKIAPKYTVYSNHFTECQQGWKNKSRASATPSRLGDDGVATGEAACGDANGLSTGVSLCRRRVILHIFKYT